MILTVIAMACVIAFVAIAFLLRARMSRLNVLYETRLHTLMAAEIVLLHEGRAPNVADVERQIRDAVQTSSVMRKNASLFRSLWPEEFDGAFYGAQRVIAQGGRILTLSERAGSRG